MSPSGSGESVVAAESPVQKTRAITGMLVVVLGDAAIAATSIVGFLALDSGSANGQGVAILASAFTAISSITTAYFGIRAATNTAQSSISARNSTSGGAPGGAHLRPAPDQQT